MERAWTRGEYTIDTARERLDLDVVHGLLARSYPASERCRERVDESVAHSLPAGVYHGEAPIGFARVITDHVVTAHPGSPLSGAGAWPSRREPRSRRRSGSCGEPVIPFSLAVR